MTLFENSNPLDAIHSRQANIRENYIWQLMTDFVERFLHRAIAARARVSIGAVNQESKTLTNVTLVFDDRHPDLGSNLRARVVDWFGFAGHQHFRRLRAWRRSVTAYLCR